MKMIQAIIQPFKFGDVKQALVEVGVHGLTVSEARGFGRQKGHKGQYRGSEYESELVQKTRIEVIVDDASLGAALEAILRAARTGEVGDGKLVVYDLDKVVRIRTRESAEKAI